MRLLFLLLFFYSLFSSVYAIEKQKGKWKTFEVLKVVDNERIMLKSQKVIRIIGIEAPSIFLPKKSEQCLVRPIYRILETLLEGQKIKIFEDYSDPQNGEFVRHVKLKDGTVLTEFLLKKGFARLIPQYAQSKYLLRYQKAEKFAREKKQGLWSGCNAWNKLKERRKKWGTYPSFYQKYGQFLASVSVGRVGKVISGNSFEFENGLKVRLIGVGIPTEAESSGTECFAKKSQKFLENLILGKKVFLISDRSQLDDEGYLLRYVYLAHDDLFVNKKVIYSGYGKSFWDNIDDKFKKAFGSIQEKVYQNPTGAWKSCVSEVLSSAKIGDETLEIKPVYDEDCRIKGNISGSKKNPKRTYHTPASGWYKRLVPERCFETESAAEVAGFLKVK